LAAFYARDLAHVHDAGFGDYARGVAPGVLRRLRRAGLRDGLVVDLGCGSGIWARILTDAGYDVLGIDYSDAMLAIARKRAPAARFERRSAIDARLPRCAAITALGEVLNYAADPRVGRGALQHVFRRAARALRPGGLLLFDLATPGRERPEPRRAWYEGDGWTMVVEAFEDPAARMLTRRMSVFRRTGRAWRRSDEVHHLRLHDPADVVADLEAAGLHARRLRGYGREYKLPRGLVAFEARRP
jgi:SAM-dependent methyltransferase